MSEQQVQFPTDELTLEGVWHLSGKPGRSPAVVMCHPHPIYGGDMDNGMVILVCRKLAKQGINALRFNFRGVGGSQGSYGEGIGEQEDLKAAIAMAASAEFVDATRIGICGYSFGAGIVLSVAADERRPRALAAISPPLTIGVEYHADKFAGPKFFLGGSEDSLFSAQALQTFVEALPAPREYDIVQGADHFWMGYERQAAQKISDFFSKVFNEDN